MADVKKTHEHQPFLGRGHSLESVTDKISAIVLAIMFAIAFFYKPRAKKQ